MILSHTNKTTRSEFRLVYDENGFDRVFYGKDRKARLLSITWNKGPSQKALIDGISYDFPANTMLCLMVNETFHFEHPEDIVAWQFNREFYCIVDHDKEVSCVGFIFYGSAQRMFIVLDNKEQQRIQLLFDVFREEFETEDTVQGEMMQVLLKRLIIIITRLAKQQFIAGKELTDDKLDTIRKYNLLVENHYRSHHQVKFYADKLHKAPKTLSNLFALYNHQSPLTVIRERLLLEAKRLLNYTDKSTKEVAAELGFEDATHFSKFFKKGTSLAPSDFRKAGLQA